MMHLNCISTLLFFASALVSACANTSAGVPESIQSLAPDREASMVSVIEIDVELHLSRESAVSGASFEKAIRLGHCTTSTVSSDSVTLFDAAAAFDGVSQVLRLHYGGMPSFSDGGDDVWTFVRDGDGHYSDAAWAPSGEQGQGKVVIPAALDSGQSLYRIGRTVNDIELLDQGARHRKSSGEVRTHYWVRDASGTRVRVRERHRIRERVLYLIRHDQSFGCA